MEKKIEYLTWDDVENNIRHIAYYVQKNKLHEKLKAIVAISRGGLTPGLMLSHIWNLPLEVIHASSYKEQEQGQLIVKVPDLSAYTQLGEGLLIVDDLVDTGNTFDAIRQHFPAAIYAALIKKPLGDRTVTFAPSRLPQDVWAQFPWET